VELKDAIGKTISLDKHLDICIEQIRLLNENSKSLVQEQGAVLDLLKEIKSID
jgi:hypothetical protein